MAAMRDVQVVVDKLRDAIQKGGSGSGNWGHAGRPGTVGGSSSRAGGASVQAAPAVKQMSRKDAVAAMGLRDTIHLNQLLKHGMPSEKIGNRRYVKWPEAEQWFDAYQGAGKGKRGIAAANAAIKTVAPPQPPTPGRQGGKFYSGNPESSTAEEIYKGSSAEVKKVADRTGIIATDEMTLKYAQDKADTFAKPGNGMTKAIQGMNADGVKRDVDALLDYDADQAGSHYAWNNPASIIQRARGQVGGMTIEESQLANRAHETYRKAFDDARARNVNSWDASTEGDKAVWADFKRTGDVDNVKNLAARLTIAKEIDGAAGKGLSYNKYKNIDLDAPDMQAPPGQIDIRMAAHNHRNTLVKNKRKFTAGSYKQGDMVALVNPSRVERHGVQQRIVRTWDQTNHGHFKFDTHRIFKIVPTAKQKARYEGAVKKYGNEVKPGDRTLTNDEGVLYHGTHYRAARSIAAGGFLVPKQVKTGRMLGNGVYLANNASKSAQYIGTGFGRGTARGMLFEVKIARGREKKWDGYNTYNDPTRPSSNPDTLWAPKRSDPRSSYGQLINSEWVVRDPAAVQPVYWIDGTRN